MPTFEEMWPDIVKAVTGKNWQELTDQEEAELLEDLAMAESGDAWKRLTEEQKKQCTSD